MKLYGKWLLDVDSWLPYTNITLVSNVDIVHVGLESKIMGCPNLVQGVYGIWYSPL